MTKIQIFRRIFECIAILAMALGFGYAWGLLTGFITYSGGIPGGVDVLYVFLIFSVLVSFGIYFLAIKFRGASGLKGPWSMIVASAINVDAMYVLCGIVYVYYFSWDKYFQHLYPGVLVGISGLISWALAAAAISLIFWLIELGLSYLLDHFVFAGDLP
jgi:hypothetical protein